MLNIAQTSLFLSICQISSTLSTASMNPSMSRRATESPILIELIASSETSSVIGIGQNIPLERRRLSKTVI